MLIQKVSPLRCEICNSDRVIVTDDGPECDDCNRVVEPEEISLSNKIEFDIRQLEGMKDITETECF